MELRVYAEDPETHFLPQTGKIVGYHEPQGLNLRIDSSLRAGDEISIYYDPMIAKVIAFGSQREQVIQKLSHALEHYCIHGVKTNAAFLLDILHHPAFAKGDTHTKFLDQHFKDYRGDRALVDLAAALLGDPHAQRSANQAFSGKNQAIDADPWQHHELGNWRMQ
jgi:acetyl/propionyl-CoA carboxylase alpha subunit